MITIKTRTVVKYERQAFKKNLPISVSHENGFYLVNPYSNYTRNLLCITDLQQNPPSKGDVGSSRYRNCYGTGSMPPGLKG